MVRTVPAVLLGAGGATAAFEYGSDVSGYVREVGRAITHHSTRPSNQPSNSGNNTALAGEIDSLKRLMLENNRSQVVVVDKGRGVGWGMLPYVVGALGLGYVYLRFKGYKLGDFMYVSKASLKASSDALKHGIDGLKDYTSKTKEYLTSRLNVLEDDQKAHMEQTERIDDRLINLGDTVDDMRTEVSEVNSHVQQVRGALGEIQDAQKYSSQGICLLLKVVGELVYHNDFKIRSRSELEQFSRAAPPMVEGTNAPGLESLLAFSTADKAGGMMEIEAPLEVSDSAMIADVNDQGYLHRNFSSESERGRMNTRAAPKVWTRDAGSRKLMHSGSDTFGLGPLRKRE